MLGKDSPMTEENKTAEHLVKMNEHLTDVNKCLIDMNEYLKGQIENLKKVVEYQNSEVDYLASVIDDVVNFQNMKEDDKVDKLIQYRENMRLAEELAGLTPSYPDDFGEEEN